ncbi:CaiB/BaiF CoA transferase family protein [Candidatus Aalborgicola defluviihabitans]|uniref:CaiB/BaiF CoA transferase family protein n=1 Tax=Candidatus Aalborgicola defluviihabitans TaxID=3386187 RepID=UPI001EC59A57|nr:CoA transferase [Burkholderiales bacterium]
MRALDGITVLDLTHMLSGPYGAMILTDLGARTIKVEPPGSGEGTRALLATSPDFARDGMGAYFLTLNRGKQSVAVDLKQKAGREVFYDMVRQADVVIDNFSVGVTRRLGIDHETLAAINPRIVTCSISGFGETGPDPLRPAFDQVVQAMGGGMSITGFADQAPVRSGIPHGDLGGGIFGAIGVLAALTAREKTGVGRHVDVSMLDVQVSMLNYMATMFLLSGEVPERMGNAHFVHVPYNSFKTSTNYIIIACIGDAFFEKFAELLGRSELRDPKYLKQPVRFADKDYIESIINEELVKHDADYWLARLRTARIPCGPVNDLAQALSDPQVRARNMVVDVQLPSGSVVAMPGNPVKISGCDDPAQPSPPPRLGEHSEAVLSDLLKYPVERIAALRNAGIVQ